MSCGVLLLVVGFAWVILNQQPPPILTPTPASVAQVERVSLQDARAALEDGEVVFLDVRAQSSYEASHISSAISIPINELPARLDELDPDSWIIPY